MSTEGFRCSWVMRYHQKIGLGPWRKVGYGATISKPTENVPLVLSGGNGHKREILTKEELDKQSIDVNLSGNGHRSLFREHIPS
ncbi:MAG TPA: hypothetical protein VI819_01945 [Patescibacteria group bacterium]|nr:hypothetical protein [Patescibacteria group bacterium]